MEKIGYTLAISIISILLFQTYFYFVNVDSEMLYTIGTFSIIILYFLIGYPTLLIVSTKSTIKSRCIRYLIATLIGVIFFILFYIKIGELENTDIFYHLVPYSFLFGIIGALLFFSPIEITRRLNKMDTI
ncbi:hypothetical protein SAMN05518871_102491 [Psychrobacillus sp. OK028]|uniref:hypothetical protein n=1 Tax=Psychrobacillus sp. OK028 TaxID=1884359 RepID=UPI00087F9FB8|nr:hypothetical protein [Psychrobacillus sp. OK028]SDM88976.1 hypothetical protein SAMN05518871_102491 [Psychrobacillus sp. OK028]